MGGGYVGDMAGARTRLSFFPDYLTTNVRPPPLHCHALQSNLLNALPRCRERRWCQRPKELQKRYGVARRASFHQILKANSHAGYTVFFIQQEAERPPQWLNRTG